PTRAANGDGHAEYLHSRRGAAFAIGARRGTLRVATPGHDIEIQRDVVADRARGRGPAGFERCGASARLFFAHMPVAISRHQQEPAASLVRHEGLRQPRQGTEVLREAEERLAHFSSVMMARCFPRTRVSVWVRSRVLNRTVPAV